MDGTEKNIVNYECDFLPGAAPPPPDTSRKTLSNISFCFFAGRRSSDYMFLSRILRNLAATDGFGRVNPPCRRRQGGFWPCGRLTPPSRRPVQNNPKMKQNLIKRR